MFSQEFDIAVCGGGVAGIAAALAAARMGHKTVMIEKTIQPGGLATSGLILGQYTRQPCVLPLRLTYRSLY